MLLRSVGNGGFCLHCRLHNRLLAQGEKAVRTDILVGCGRSFLGLYERVLSFTGGRNFCCSDRNSALPLALRVVVVARLCGSTYLRADGA